MMVVPAFFPLAVATVYGAFTKTATYSIANELGFFAQVGLDVKYQQIPNSTFGYGQLLSGGYDVVTGTIDNAVNLRFNSQKPVTVLGQLDGGPDLVIASVPSITKVQDLKGKTIIVDSPVSGFAYILRRVLSLYGLRLENGDYSFQTVGGTSIRYQDLLAGMLPNGSAVYATILTYPFPAEAAILTTPNKPNILARISDFIQPLSSTAITATEASLADAAKRALLTKFLGAMYAANHFLADPRYKECSIIAIAKTLNITVALAATEYTAAIDPLTGETSSPGGDFTVSRQGLLNVIDVRDQFGGFAGAGPSFDFAAAIKPGMGKLIDYSIRDQSEGLIGGIRFAKRYCRSL